MVTFGETRAHTSRKCVVVQGMNLKKSSKKHKLIWFHSLKMLIFEIFLPVREPLVSTFKETRAVTSPKDMVKQGMKISKAWEKHKLLWQFSSVLALKITSKILTFEGFLPLK